MSASKRKGTAAESAVVAWLQAHGFPYAERRALAGNTDRGDIAGIPGVALEVKNVARMALAEWVDEARKEGANAKAPVWAVVHKRKGKGSPGEWYVTTDLATFARLCSE